MQGATGIGDEFWNGLWDGFWDELGESSPEPKWLEPKSFEPNGFMISC